VPIDISFMYADVALSQALYALVSNHLLTGLSLIPFDLFPYPPSFGSSTPNRQPGASWSPLDWQPNASLGWERAAG
jgi:hypothetical protein